MGQKSRKRAEKVLAPAPTPASPLPDHPRAHVWAICASLCAAVAAVYGRTAGHPFVSWDDTAYLVTNQQVQAGLTWAGVKWAFTSFHAYNWHPLTWLSHMLDCQLFGMHAGAHHLVSVALHGANSVLLFLLLRRATARLWPPAAVAALFALHPMHVESVAWAAERKDVLSTLFFLLAMRAHVVFVESPSLARRGAVALWLALGLLSKPMVVTLPFVLLLLDWWPLGRFRGRGWRALPSLALEKLPLLALVAVSAALTVVAQHAGGAVQELGRLPLDARVANATIAYVRYVGKLLWPVDLAVFYPYPAVVSLPLAAAAAAVLAFLTALAWMQGARRPWIATGWLFFLGTLVPVIGLVQVGEQSMADRYSYIPSIGLFVVVAWSLAELVDRQARLRPAVTAVAASVVAALAWLTFVQVGYWRDTLALFEHTIAVTTGNYTVNNNLGTALMKRERYNDAEARYREALRIKPDYLEARAHLGVALEKQKRKAEAETAYRAALAQDPDFVPALYNLGTMLHTSGRPEDAIPLYERALRVKPDYQQARGNLAAALYALGRLKEAEREMRQTVSASPAWAEAHQNLGAVLLRQGRASEAVVEYREAVRLKPGDTRLQQDLSRAEQAARGQ